MATIYVRAAGGNSNAAATYESSPGANDVVSIPTSSTEIEFHANSCTGAKFIINAALACRRFNVGTNPNLGITHGDFALTVGDGTAPTGGVALVLSGIYTLSGTTSSIVFASSGAGIHTIDTGNKTIQAITFSGTASYQFITNNSTITGALLQTAGTIDFNGLIFSVGGLFSSTGATTRTLTFGNAIINTSMTGGAFTYSGSNLTITSNTARFIFSGASPAIVNVDALNFNGLTIVISGVAGTFTMSNSCSGITIVIKPTTTKTFAITGGKTVTVTNMYCVPEGGLITMSGGIISKSSGIVNLHQITSNTITFTGGATFNLLTNCDAAGVLGLTKVGGISYVDNSQLGGNDNLAVAYGFYKVSYTGATGTCPTIGDIVTGVTSTKTAIISMIDPYEWSIGAGTMYFHNRSAAFVSEQVDLVSGAHFHISGDLQTNACWSTMSLGASSTRIAPGDTLRIIESGRPISLGSGTWTGQPTTLVGAFAFTSTTNNGGLIQVNRVAHGHSTGDILYIQDHAAGVNEARGANGIWKITRINADAFTLNGSKYIVDGGATGSTTLVTRGVVQLDTAPCTVLSRCQNAWTASGSSTLTVDTSAYKDGDASLKFVKASPSASTLYAYWATGDININNMQYMSFWMRNEVAIVAGNWKICLCSDIAGANIVAEYLMPALDSTSKWLPMDILPQFYDIDYTAGGTSTPIIGDILTSGTATCVIQSLTTTSGSWAAGTAAGTFRCIHKTGTFATGACSITGGKTCNTVGDLLNKVGSYIQPNITIKSIAIYSGLVAASTTGIYFNDFIVSTYLLGTNFTFRHLISKCSVPQATTGSAGYGNESWYGVRCISQDGTLLMLDNSPDRIANYNNQQRAFGYSGATESVTTYMKIPTCLYITNSQTGTREMSINKSGIAGFPIQVQGGWGATTGLQDGETIMDGANGFGSGISGTNFNYIRYNFVGGCRNYYGINVYGNGVEIINAITCVNNSVGVSVQAYPATITNCIGLSNNNQSGLSLQNMNTSTIANIVNCSNNASNGIYLNGITNYVISNISGCHNNLSTAFYTLNCANITVVNITDCKYTYQGVSLQNSQDISILNAILEYSTYGIYMIMCSNIKILAGYTQNNSTGSVYCDSTYALFTNFIMYESLEVSKASINTKCNTTIQSYNHDQSGEHWTFFFSATLNTQNKTLTNASGTKEYKCEITNGTTYRSSSYPVRIPLARVYLAANQTPVVKLWIKKSHATNIVAKLVCKSGQLAGLTNEQSQVSPSDTIENEVTLTFAQQPTVAGVIDLELQVYNIGGTTNNILFDKITITQS